MKISNHHILEGDNITYKESPNHSGKFNNDLPDTIVIHYTAGSSVSGAVRTLSTPKYKASAHLVIGMDGEVVQLVPFNIVAWHAGRSSWEGRSGLNQFSIGIELDNPGKLEKVGNGYQSWFGKIYPEDVVMKAVHRNESVERYWHTYTEEQLQKNEEICKLLIEEYNIKTIVGHEEISPRNKIDPGPAFPLDKFRDRLLDSSRKENEEEDDVKDGVVTASSLNIRSGPDVEEEKVAEPLKNGTEVQVVDENQGWLKVRVEVEGWVYGKYVQKK